MLDPDLHGAIQLVSRLTRGLLDPWLDSIILVAIRRRNAIRRRRERLIKGDPQMSSKHETEKAEAFKNLSTEVQSLLKNVSDVPLGEIPLHDLHQVEWVLSLLSGVGQEEIARRTGDQDMAFMESIGETNEKEENR